MTTTTTMNCFGKQIKLINKGCNQGLNAEKDDKKMLQPKTR